MIATATPMHQPTARRRLIVIANGKSGSQADDALELLAVALRERGASVELWAAERPEQLPALAQRAREAAPDAVIAFGGDGTVNTVASALAGSPVALAIAPRGTFNYVAKQYRLPETPDEIAELVINGPAASIPAGEVNGRLFLNNCSFGLYTDVIEARERHKAQWGRFRLVAVLSALLTALRSRARLPLRVADAEGRERYRGRASLLFAGVNARQFSDAGFELAEAVKAGALGFVLVRSLSPWRVLTMLAGALAGTVEQLQHVEAFSSPALAAELPHRRQLRAVIDGEMLTLRPPLRFRHRPAALLLVQPEPEPVAAAAP